VTQERRNLTSGLIAARDVSSATCLPLTEFLEMILFIATIACLCYFDV